MRQFLKKIQTSLFLSLLVVSMGFNLRYLHSRTIDYLVESSPSDYDTIRLTGSSIWVVLLLANFGIGLFNLKLLCKAIKESGNKHPILLWIVFALFTLLTIITPVVVADVALPGLNNTIGVALLTSLVYLTVSMAFAGWIQKSKPKYQK